MENRKIPVKNLYLLLVICIGLVCLGIGSTYAVFTATSNIVSPISLASNLTYNSNLMETVSVTVPAGETVTSTLNVNNSTSDTLNYVIYYIDEGLDIELGTSSGSVTGTLEASASTSVEVAIRNNSDEEVTVIVGIMSSTDSVVLGSSMTMVPSSALNEIVNLVTHISNLYTNATKTEVTNNSIVYNYASDVSLMNDRLGGTTEDYDAGNIRYYGASPNNYIYYNCETYPETNCEKWRIIGVFKDIEVVQEDETTVTQDLVKIVRDDSIGDLAWDQEKNIDSTLTTYSADWSNSSLNIFLNGKYYARGVTNSMLYYSGNSGMIETVLDMNAIGLKNSTTTNMIESVIWSIFGKSTNSVYSDQVYAYERATGETMGTIDTASTGKIALMYPSDYGYATDFTECSGKLGEYSASGCYDNDWMYQSNVSQWLLTPIYSGVSSGQRAWYISSTGLAYSDYGTDYSASYVYLNYAVRPSLYLHSSVSIISGDGSTSNPYRISLN